MTSPKPPAERSNNGSEQNISERLLQPRKILKVQSLDLDSEVKLKDVVVTVNTSGLAILPDELLLEIFQYFPPIPFVIQMADPQEDNANKYIARREMLLALSTTCRNLRRFFRPHIWNRIEVCAGMRVDDHILEAGDNIDKERFTLELVRQLEIVTIRDPNLAEYVTVINVEVKDHSIRPLLAELARSMSLFPSLHTVKLKITHHLDSDASAKIAFSKYSYPQIRTLLLSKCAYPLLLSCPQVRSIRTMEWNPSTELMPIVLSAKNFPPLEEVEVCFPHDNLQDIGKAFPNLRTIVLRFSSRWIPIFPDDFTPIHKFRCLKSITIWFGWNLDSVLRGDIMGWAKQFLLDLQAEDKEDKEVKTLDGHDWRWNKQVISLPAPNRKIPLSLAQASQVIM